MASAKWAAANGSWYVATNWSSGSVPGGNAGPDDAVTIDAAGNYTVKVGSPDVTTIGSVSVNAPGATLGVSLQGLAVKTALTLNSGRLLLQGTLQGGSLVMNGGIVMRNDAAALDGVRVQGTLDLAAPYQYGVLTLSNYGQLTLLNNTSFFAADGVSPGRLRVGGSAVTFGNSAQFDNASIDFAAGYSTAGSLNLGTDQDATGETVTFGKHALLDVAANATVTLGGMGTLVNGGTINVEGTLIVSPLINLVQATQPGTLTLRSGGTLVFAAPTLFGSAITFNDATAQVVFQASGAAGATLQDFQNGDSIDLQGITYGDNLTISLQSNTVHVNQAGLSVADFQLAGGVAGYSVDQFSLAADDFGGTVLRTTHVLNPDFDAPFYLASNPDVAASGMDPLQHFLLYGWKEHRNPDAFFNTSYYLAQNPDVAAAGVDPLMHYEAYGWHEGRDPGPNFSVSKYLAAYPDVKAAAIDPLQQFLNGGRAQGRVASPVTPTVAVAQDALLDRTWYLAQNPDVAASGMDALLHYQTYGWHEGRNPDAFFDTNYYLAQNPDVKASGMNPLLHFEQYGRQEGREPSLLFSDAKYLAANPDVGAAGLSPLAHYLSYGQSEGRMAFLAGGTAAADPLVNAAYYDRQLGATLIPVGLAGQQQAAASYDAGGWQKGLNPDAYFDTNYYLAHNPDARAAGTDPLKQYEATGWKAGYDPSAAFSTTKYLAAYADVRASGVDPLTSFITTGQAQGRTAFAV